MALHGYLEKHKAGEEEAASQTPGLGESQF